MCTALLPSQLGKLTALGTLPSSGIANRMLWWLTSAGKYPKEVNHHKPDGTPIFESIFLLPQAVLSSPLGSTCGLFRAQCPDKLLKRFFWFLLGRALAKQEGTARSVSGVIFMVMVLVVPGAVCKQQEHLLQGKRLISGLMKPENMCHVPAHAAVVPELRNHWQGLRTAFLCRVPTKALGLWSKIKILPVSKVGKAPVPAHCCSPSVPSHLCWNHSLTSTQMWSSQFSLVKMESFPSGRHRMD